MADSSKHKEKVVKRYDKFSKYYDSLDSFPGIGKGEMRRRLEAVRMLDPMPHETILDVGTGSGAILPVIADLLNTGKVVGVDLSEKMLAVAKKRVGEAGLDDRVEIKVEDIEKMTFEDAGFDAVIGTYALTTVPDPKSMMNECARVLKPGGRMVILDTGPPTSKGGLPLYYWMRLTAALFGYTYINRKLVDYLPDNLAIEKEERFLATTVYCTLLRKK